MSNVFTCVRKKIIKISNFRSKVNHGLKSTKLNFSMLCQCDRCSIFPLNNRSTVATIISRLIDFKVNLIAKRNQQSFAKYSRDIKRLFFHFELWILKKKKKKSWFSFCV